MKDERLKAERRGATPLPSSTNQLNKTMKDYIGRKVEAYREKGFIYAVIPNYNGVLDALIELDERDPWGRKVHITFPLDEILNGKCRFRLTDEA